MTEQDADTDLIRAWSEASRVMPGEALDARVLAKARAHRLRRRLMPFMALAACLALAMLGLQRNAVPPKQDARQIEGRATQFLMKVDVADHALAAPTATLD